MTLSFIAALLILQTRYVGSIPGAGNLGVPENITVTFLNPTSVKVSWATAVDNVDKYDVTYKPTDARVVAVVAGNSGAVTLSGLLADTQYQLTVAAVCAGRKYKSGPVVFRTLEPPRTSPQQDAGSLGAADTPSAFPGVLPPPSSSPGDDTPQPFPTIRGVEVGIVVMVLIVWIGAITLFFNRWGKIRMLLPYQPDYKQEQLKVPGTGACAAAAASTSCTGNHGGHACSQHFHWSTHHMTSLDCEDHSPLTHHHRRSRPRVNSAIFTSNDTAGFAGFDAGDFLRRYGSQSKLCRKARSADNIPLTTMEEVSTEKNSREEINLDSFKNDTPTSSAPTSTTTTTTTATHHFGLPILSVSGPSPPDEDSEQMDEYL